MPVGIAAPADACDARKLPRSRHGCREVGQEWLDGKEILGARPREWFDRVEELLYGRVDRLQGGLRR
jgi:hypothetical protein